MIEVRTLGQTSVQRDGLELEPLGAQKQRYALLVYLLMEGPTARNRLLKIFWPDRTPEKARHSLSQALYSLRRDLGEGCVSAHDDEIHVDSDEIVIDARLLEAAAAQEDWERVVEVYEGPFLNQFTLPGAREVEEWCSLKRTSLARIANRAFARVVDERTKSGDIDGALAAASRWAELAPLDDEAQHALIALLAHTGHRITALDHFDKYRKRLARELGAEPLEPTLALVESIRSGDLPAYPPLAGFEIAGPRGITEETESEPADSFGDREVAKRPPPPRPPGSLIKRLQERWIFQVALAYLAVSWLTIQVVDILVDNLPLPERTFPVTIIILAIGLPIVLVLAWAQEQPRAEVDTGAGFWPEWMRRVGPRHVMVILGLSGLVLLPTYVILQRTAPPAISEALSPFDRNQIAVLFFDDLSSDSSLASLSRELTENLISRLQAVDALSVRSHHAARRFQNSAASVDSIARSLRVGTIVGGTLQKIGTDSVRVRVDLMDHKGSLEAQFESTTSLATPLPLLEETADKLARLLRVHLGEQIKLAKLVDQASSDLAWKLVQRAEERADDARRLMETGDLEAATRYYALADSTLQEAEAVDSKWLEPLIQRGWLAERRAVLSLFTDPSPPTEPNAEAARWLSLGIGHADRALERRRDYAPALELRGALQLRLAQWGDWARADSLLAAAHLDLTSATVSDESRARAWYLLSELLVTQGNHSEATLKANKALEQDAYAHEARSVFLALFNAWLKLEDYESADHWCAVGRRHFEEDPRFLDCQLTLLGYSAAGDQALVRAWNLVATIDTFPQLEEGWPERHLFVAAILARSGMTDSARHVLSRTVDRVSPEVRPRLHSLQAYVLALLGDTDFALDLIEALIELEPAMKGFVATHPWYKSLREHPRFRALVRPED